MRPVLLALSVVACRTETRLRAPADAWGVPNPPALETPTQVDRITQVTVPAVDVLFVVDNSCSMEEEQTQLGTNFPAMLAWFLDSALDFHVGVVSTDMNDPLESGKLRAVGDQRWIDGSVEAPESVFASMVQMGTTGSGYEKGRAAAYTAIELQRDGANAGFVREGAAMHVAVVSDENDASGDSPISLDEFVAFLVELRPSRRLVSFSSIVGPLAGCPYVGSPGTEYLEVTARVGGVVWPICSEDWTAMLDELGFLAVGLSREFYLSRLPVPGTIEVALETGGATLPMAPREWVWSETRNSVTFVDLVPDPLAVVVISYEVRAGDDPGAETPGTEPPPE